MTIYSIQDLATYEFSRYSTGGLRVFTMYKMARAYRDQLNRVAGFGRFVIRKEAK